MSRKGIKVDDAEGMLSLLASPRESVLQRMHDGNALWVAAQVVNEMAKRRNPTVMAPGGLERLLRALMLIAEMRKGSQQTREDVLYCSACIICGILSHAPEAVDKHVAFLMNVTNGLLLEVDQDSNNAWLRILPEGPLKLLEVLVGQPDCDVVLAQQALNASLTFVTNAINKRKSHRLDATFLLPVYRSALGLARKGCTQMRDVLALHRARLFENAIEQDGPMYSFEAVPVTPSEVQARKVVMSTIDASIVVCDA